MPTADHTIFDRLAGYRDITLLGSLPAAFFAPLLRFCLYPLLLLLSSNLHTQQHRSMAVAALDIAKECMARWVGRSDLHANMDGENGGGIPHLVRDVLAPRTLEWGT